MPHYANYSRIYLNNLGDKLTRVSRSVYCDACAARWQSGYAADCNSVYAGSIPTLASIYPTLFFPFSSVTSRFA